MERAAHRPGAYDLSVCDCPLDFRLDCRAHPQADGPERAQVVLRLNRTQPTNDLARFLKRSPHDALAGEALARDIHTTANATTVPAADSTRLILSRPRRMLYARRGYSSEDTMKLKSACKLLFLALLVAACSAGVRAQVTAIRAGKLVDPETGTVAANQVILVEGQTIKAVGPDLKIPSGATVINLSDRTVLPGLFDAHTHLCMTTRRE